jgi:hypothetical protein
VGGFEVSADELTRAGDGVVETAQSVEVAAQPLAGMAAGDAGSNAGFATGREGGRCEHGWQQALQFASSKLAASGDKLTLSASEYAETESANTGMLGPR